MVRRLLALCPLFWLAIAAAQTSPYEGLTITALRFDPAAQPLDAAELHHLLPLEINRPLRMTDVREAIGRLFATGRYADVRVDAERSAGGVALVFVTSGAWFIGAVGVGGRISSPPDAGQLENVAGLNLGEPYTEAKLKNALADQERLLESNGLFLSEVHPVFDWETTRRYQQMNLRFLVNGGPRARFATPVLTGDLKMDQARILEATRFRRWLIHTWKPMTQTRMREALDSVRTLYEKDNRLEAKVTLESMHYDAASNQATPTLHVDAGPRIQVNPVGDKLSVKILRRYIPIFEEHAVDHDLLAEGAGNLRDYLQSKGYFDADVQFKEQAVINDRANIDYLINTGSRHRLVYIEIAGNHYFTKETIRERMFLQARKRLEFPHGRYSEGLLRRDEETIASLYQSNGFRDVKVTHRVEDNYQERAGDLAVYLTIDEGPQYFIAHVQVDGIEHLDRAALAGRLSSIAGQPFSEFNVALDRDTILAGYAARVFPTPLSNGVPRPPPRPISSICATPSRKAASSSCAR